MVDHLVYGRSGHAELFRGAHLGAVVPASLDPGQGGPLLLLNGVGCSHEGRAMGGSVAGMLVI